MDQISSELKKILMAGLGAVSTGVEKSQQVISQLAEKGEQTFEQAKEMSKKAADHVKKAYDDSGLAEFFSTKVKKESIAEDLEALPKEDLAWLRDQLDQLIDLKEIEDALKKVAEPDAEEKTEEPKEEEKAEASEEKEDEETEAEAEEAEDDTDENEDDDMKIEAKRIVTIEKTEETTTEVTIEYCSGADDDDENEDDDESSEEDEDEDK